MPDALLPSPAYTVALRAIHLLLLCAACAGVARGERQFPRPDWKESASPLADPRAVVGGAFSMYGGPYPKSLNYYLEFSTGSAMIYDRLYDTLLVVNPLTLELEPWLADRWTISDDLREYTFHIDPNAKWSDGRPITADDVAWTYEAVMKPESMTGPWKNDLERFDPPVVVDAQTIRFTARHIHWNNLLTLANLYIMPKHAFAGLDFNKVNFELPVVSGPYRVGELREGLFVTLERRADWWRIGYPAARGLGNFQTLKLVFFQEDDTAFDVFKKGRLDYVYVGSARRWVVETRGDKYDRGWIVKQKIHNYNPPSFAGFAMNLRRPPFDDVRVRRALALLLDRERLNRTIMYDQYVMQNSYWPDLYTADHPCTNVACAYDPEQAGALLKEAGWAMDPATGLLRKGDQTLRFTFTGRVASENKFLVIYQECLRKAGIDMKIETKDWSAWIKLMDEFKFDMTWCSYSGVLWKNPEGMWYSKEADRISGSNVTGFRNARVDQLIESQFTELDVQKRNAICREIDGILTAEVPYILLWGLDYERIAYWNKFGMPPHVIGNIGDYRSPPTYWWYDPDAADALAEAMRTGEPLPPRPFDVRYDDVAPREAR